MLTDEALASLVEHGYLVVDGALAPSLCRKLREEMDALDREGQYWNSQSYAAEQGTPHRHIQETSLEHKQVRAWAPTFAKIERDATLTERLRGTVPGLSGLATQHVRIQMNLGHGGCYTMHTDAGTADDAADGAQHLLITALFYLNPEWREGDGGELRIARGRDPNHPTRGPANGETHAPLPSPAAAVSIPSASGEDRAARRSARAF